MSGSFWCGFQAHFLTHSGVFSAINGVQPISGVLGLFWRVFLRSGTQKSHLWRLFLAHSWHFWLISGVLF